MNLGDTMKKQMVIFCIGFLFLTAGCTQEKIKEVKVTPTPTPVATRESIKCTTENTIALALYQKENGVRKKVDTHTHSLVLNEDFAVFSVFITQEEQISGNSILDVFPAYYEKIADKNYKIGYDISFLLQDGTSIQKTILNPNDAAAIYDYMQVYLYDDIHQKKGAWYSHVESMQENTLLTTIKLTGSSLTDQIASPITVTAFLYQDDKDFNEKQKYTGCHFYKATIQRK